MALPREIKDAILSVDGRGYVGKAKGFDWPKLAKKMQELRTGGMSGAVETDFGEELMGMSFTMYEHSPELIKLYGICDAGGALIRINASAETDDAACSSAAVEVLVRGRFKELDMGSFASGERGETKFDVTLSYFKYSLNGDVLIEADPLNSKLIVGGVDRYEQRRKNLKL